ncbi:hypothetical protein FN846DRAFT_894049 [Sphaerosporella brunnea]|uniref:Uncharacterized protein n=1 Tax=Sphaerosporella brunnea TaxID=1250544 RepID=A0A5J5EKF9_9PEZI|nr:hypothetical protein FN846DRAFT_894049 [Sphaerosporella brunnea]
MPTADDQALFRLLQAAEGLSLGRAGEPATTPDSVAAATDTTSWDPTQKKRKLRDEEIPAQFKTIMMKMWAKKNPEAWRKAVEEGIENGKEARGAAGEEEEEDEDGENSHEEDEEEEKEEGEEDEEEEEEEEEEAEEEEEGEEDEDEGEDENGDQGVEIEEEEVDAEESAPCTTDESTAAGGGSSFIQPPQATQTTQTPQDAANSSSSAAIQVNTPISAALGNDPASTPTQQYPIIPDQGHASPPGWSQPGGMAMGGEAACSSSLQTQSPSTFGVPQPIYPTPMAQTTTISCSYIPVGPKQPYIVCLGGKGAAPLRPHNYVPARLPPLTPRLYVAAPPAGQKRAREEEEAEEEAENGDRYCKRPIKTGMWNFFERRVARLMAERRKR